MKYTVDQFEACKKNNNIKYSDMENELRRLNNIVDELNRDMEQIHLKEDYNLNNNKDWREDTQIK